jgi:hypothetical protein
MTSPESCRRRAAGENLGGPVGRVGLPRDRDEHLHRDARLASARQQAAMLAVTSVQKMAIRIPAPSRG